MINAVAQLTQEVQPYQRQDVALKYRVRTDKTLLVDADISEWTMRWVLFQNGVAVITKTTAAGGIIIESPYATVVITDTEMDIDAGEYHMQLQRSDDGFTYPVTGFGTMNVLEAAP